MELELLAMQIIPLSLGALPETLEGRLAQERRPKLREIQVSPVNIKPGDPRPYMLCPHIFEGLLQRGLHRFLKQPGWRCSLGI